MAISKEQEKIMADVYRSQERDYLIIDADAIRENASNVMEEELEANHPHLSGTPKGEEIISYFADMVLANVAPPNKARPLIIRKHGGGLEAHELDKTRFLGE